VAGVGRGQLIRVKPGRVALNSSELEDAEEITINNITIKFYFTLFTAENISRRELYG